MTALGSPRSLPFIRPRPTATLWAGLIIILICEGLLFTDVYLSRRGSLKSHAQIQTLKANNPPTTPIARAARYMAVNMTAIVWVGYLLFIEGILELLGAGQVDVSSAVPRLGRALSLF